MARARNIKPGFFKNEDLGECTIPARLCFIGMWGLADREGRQEDRPKRIKGEVFPFDDLDVEPLLVELNDRAFIRRYIWAGKRYIQIINFVKHQTPHGTEKDGECPDENGLITVHERRSNGYVTGNWRLELVPLTVNGVGSTPVDSGALTVNEGGSTPPNNSATTVSQQLLNTLNPDSPNPDSLIQRNTPLPPKGGGRKTSPKSVPDGFEAWYALYQRKDARAAAEKAWRALGPDDALQARMIAALRAWRWNPEREKNPHPATWINGRRWEDESVASTVGSPRLATANGKPAWLLAAGFDNLDEANNFGCHSGNAKNFRDGARIAPDEAAA